MFLTHFNHANQIDKAYASHSLIVIFILLMSVIVFTLRKRCLKDDLNEFLHFDTSNTLRAIAIFFLIFGHFAIKCIDGKYFFEFAGKWAVIIFLYVSGVALSKTYGVIDLTNLFIFKRIKKLLFPTWITLALFFILGIYL